MNDHEKPDLKKGVSLAGIPDGGKLLGVVDGEAVLLVRRGDFLTAVSSIERHSVHQRRCYLSVLNGGFILWHWTLVHRRRTS
jgi:hypothetical protein